MSTGKFKLLNGVEVEMTQAEVDQQTKSDTQLFNEALQSLTPHRFTWIYTVLQNLTKFCSVLQSFPKFYRVFQSFAEFCTVLKSLPKFYRVFQSFTLSDIS